MRYRFYKVQFESVHFKAETNSVSWETSVYLNLLKSTLVCDHCMIALQVISDLHGSNWLSVANESAKFRSSVFMTVA